MSLLVSGAIWIGTAQVYVMNWEGGGEHPYRTDFELIYHEASPTEVRDARGTLVGHRIRLIPERIALKVQHEVVGLLNCVGTGEEVVRSAAEGAIVIPVRGQQVRGTDDRPIPSFGAYQVVLPRAYAAYACGENQRNKGDRRAGIGRGLFYADVEFGDRGARSLDSDGDRMHGAYEYQRERSADGSIQHLVRKEIHVKWDLRRVASSR